LGRFDEAIALAEKQIELKRQEQSELNRFMGQSLFNQVSGSLAVQNIKELVEWNNEITTSWDTRYYKLGLY
jgi:hypothetical protein